MSRGSCPWGAPCIVFNDVWRLLDVQILTKLSGFSIPGGSPLKPFARLRRFGSDECLEDLGSGRLKVSYSTRSRGSRRSCSGWK